MNPMQTYLETMPQGIDPELICDIESDRDKRDRAEGIVYPLGDIKGKNILDFGCGEGHCSEVISEDAKVVGYDIKKHDNALWNNPGLVLTDDLEKAKAYGPFDIVLLYDVLDRAEGTIKEILDNVRGLCSETARVHVLCHPWCSRHGGNIYRKVNKAFAHLLFDSQALQCEPSNQGRISDPSLYERAFNDSMFEIFDVTYIRDEVEPFFYNNLEIRKKLQETVGDDPFSFWKLGNSFIKYVLKPTSKKQIDFPNVVATMQRRTNQWIDFGEAFFYADGVFKKNKTDTNGAARWKVEDNQLHIIWGGGKSNKFTLDDTGMSWSRTDSKGTVVKWEFP